MQWAKRAEQAKEQREREGVVFWFAENVKGVFQPMEK